MTRKIGGERRTRMNGERNEERADQRKMDRKALWASDGDLLSGNVERELCESAGSLIESAISSVVSTSLLELNLTVIMRQMTVPLWAALLSLFVACTPPLQAALHEVEPLRASVSLSSHCG